MIAVDGGRGCLPLICAACPKGRETNTANCGAWQAG